MSTHYICFRGEIRTILHGYPLLSGVVVILLFMLMIRGISLKIHLIVLYISFLKPKISILPRQAKPNASSGICGQRRPRSACASAQSDQGLQCPLTEKPDTTICMNGEQRPG